MVTQITLGNFYTTSEGKQVLGGAGGSGLDTETIINALTEAKRFPAIQDEKQITSNGKITEALNQFNTLLSNFQNAADALRNPPGVGNAASNAFLFTTSSITSSTAIAGSTYLTVSTSPGASLQNYRINEVTSVATTATQSTTIFTLADEDDSVVTAAPGVQEFGTGTITVNGQDITLEEGDSLGRIAAKFNAVSDNTGITATVIKISATQYQLSFSATDTGTANDFDLTDPGTVTAGSGLLTNVGFNAAVGATDAVFQINGVSVTRSSNAIADVISGVTFNLIQATPGGTTLTVGIKPDTVTAQNTIVNFVTAYNALKEFEAQQVKLDSDGTYAEDAVLANNTAFRNIMFGISSEISAKVAGLATTNSLSDIGISFFNQPATDDVPLVYNMLNVDDGKLTEALATNFSGVRKLFGFSLTSSNPNLAVFEQTNALSVSSFTLNIDPGTNTFEATYDLGAGPVTVSLTATAISGSSGYTLRGPDSSALAGLVLIYASNNAANFSVTATQGIASRIFNAADTATELNTGTIAIELQSIEDRNSKLEESIARIDLQVAQYREQLVAKFTALEQAISRVNILLQSLDAQQRAADNAS